MKSETFVRVRLTPRSGKNEIQRYADGVLSVRVTAPPVDGAANAALIALLASVFRVPKTSIRIVSGASCRDKRLIIESSSPEQVQQVLESFSACSPEVQNR